MPRIDLAFDSFDKIDPGLRDALSLYLGPKAVSELNESGATLTISISSKRPVSTTAEPDQKSRRRLDSTTFVRDLERLSNDEAAFFGMCASMPKIALREACKQVGLSSPADKTNIELANSLYKYFRFSKDWNAISGNR